jgi:hypothetical protein
MNNEVQSGDTARDLLESIVLWVESTSLERRVPATVKHARRFLDRTEPAQPVEAMDAFATIPDAIGAPTPELWRAYEAFNGVYKGFNTQQALRAAINGVLAERTALARPRPTGDDLTTPARGLLADYEADHGEGACDCRPEPENAGHTCNACLIRAALAQPRPVGVPDGWKLVPVKAMREITEAGRRSLIESSKANVTYDTTAAYAYEEMVAAAPAPAKAGGA